MFDMTLALTGHKYEKCSFTKSVNSMFLNKISCLVGKWKCFFNNYRFPFPRTDFHFASYTLHFATFRLLVHSANCRFSSQISLFAKPRVSQMFLPHFDIFCDLLLNRCSATWNLFVLYNEKWNIVYGDVKYLAVLKEICTRKNHSGHVYHSVYHVIKNLSRVLLEFEWVSSRTVP